MAITAFQGIARRFIPKMLQTGMSASAGLRLLQKQGLGYRRTLFLADWREFGGIARKVNPLRAIPKSLRPTAATVQRTEFEQTHKFNYEYKIGGYDTILDKDTETFITVASDDILTMEQAEEEAKRLADHYRVDIDIAYLIINAVTVK